MGFITKHFSKVLWGTFLVSAVGIGYIANYNNKLEKRKQLLLENALVKADTNRDGVLQNKEISGLLKDIGNYEVIPDNKNIAFKVENKTSIWYGSGVSRTVVGFGEEDLKRYLSE